LGQTWQIDIILVVLDNLSVDWIGQNKEIWDKYSSYLSPSSFIYFNFDCFEDFYTTGHKIHFPQNSVCFQKWIEC
jgi:hypothetical protein